MKYCRGICYFFSFFFFDGVFAFVRELVLKCRSVYVGVSASLCAELEGGLGKAGMQCKKIYIIIKMYLMC